MPHWSVKFSRSIVLLGFSKAPIYPFSDPAISPRKKKRPRKM